MTTTYQMYSPMAKCDYQFKFDENGVIVGFEIMGVNKFSEEKTQELFSGVPKTIAQLKDFAKRNKRELVEIKPDLSFTAFWNKYGYKVGKLKQTEDLWNKLSEKNKNMAMDYIDKQKAHLAVKGTATPYASSYLNGQYWLASLK